MEVLHRKARGNRVTISGVIYLNTLLSTTGRSTREKNN